MAVAAHVELPPSATIPHLARPSADELAVGYEVPNDDAPNDSWVARYRTGTLAPLGAPSKGAQPASSDAERTLPAEIPLPDRYSHAVFADR